MSITTANDVLASERLRMSRSVRTLASGRFAFTAQMAALTSSMKPAVRMRGARTTNVIVRWTNNSSPQNWRLIAGQMCTGQDRARSARSPK